jgi:PAS domain S-box-containing protein
MKSIYLFFWIATCFLSASAGERTIRVGVLAYRGRVKCHSRWQQTITYLSKSVKGHNFILVPLEFDAVDQAVKKKEIDFILVNSSMYISISRRHKVSRIVTLENLFDDRAYNVFGGVIFARKDNTRIKSIKDLANTKFMAVKDSSFGGWQMAWLAMKEKNFDPNTQLGALTFGGTHDAVVMAVKAGKVDAGTVRTDILEKMANEGKIKLEEFQVINKMDYPADRFPFLCSTNLYPEWPFSKLTHVAPELSKGVAIALMRMPRNSSAAQAAGIAGWSPPLNYHAVELCLQKLRVGPFADYGKVTLRNLWRDHHKLMIFLFLAVVLIIIYTLYIIHINKKLKYTALARKKELAERQRAEREMRQIFNTSGDGMRVLRNDKTILQVNEQYLLMMGYSRDELEGHSCIGFCEDIHDCDTEECVLNKVMHSERVENDIKLKRKDGSTIPTIMTAVPYYNTESEIIGTIQIFKDISDRLKAEEASALKAEQRGKIEMASSVLHDIGNAVTGMGAVATGYMGETEWPENESLEMLKKMFASQADAIDQAMGDGKSGKLQIFIEKLRQSLGVRKNDLDETFVKISRSVSHISDVLALQRMYASPKESRPASANIIELIKDAVAMLSASIHKRGISLKYHLPQGLPDIKLDKTRVLQVLINVFKNACESFDVVEKDIARVIDIKIIYASDNINISIKDNASGFVAEGSEHFFDNGYSSKMRGSGIGLYQCRSIIESHGGSIDIQSKGPGLGAVVNICFPVHDAGSKDSHL